MVARMLRNTILRVSLFLTGYEKHDKKKKKVVGNTLLKACRPGKYICHEMYGIYIMQTSEIACILQTSSHYILNEVLHYQLRKRTSESRKKKCLCRCSDSYI